MRLKQVNDNVGDTYEAPPVAAGIVAVVDDDVEQSEDEDEVEQDRIEHLENFAIRVRCHVDRAEGSQEFYVVMRDINGADLRAIGQWRKEGHPDMDMNNRLITRLCTKWNTRPGVSLKELDGIRAKNLILLGGVTASFLE